MCAHTFGQDKCFSMFGGLHIEKLLLEIHRQLIAARGLLITGAGNVALNDPNISSALYLIQVCLYPEFKARILLLENEEAILDFEKWVNEKAYESPMFHYLKMIFDLQVLIPWFVCSERERKFNLMF